MTVALEQETINFRVPPRLYQYVVHRQNKKLVSMATLTLDSQACQHTYAMTASNVAGNKQ